MIMNLLKRIGFSLHELLIVITVLGIVAALTMPTLNANIQSRKWGAASSDFEREFAESLRIMNLRKSLAGHATTRDFVNRLNSYIKISKVCGQDKLAECFPEEIFWGGGDTAPVAVNIASIENSGDLNLGGWDSEMMGLQFASGVSALITYNPDCKLSPLSNDVNFAECTRLLYDVNGFSYPNRKNQDVRSLLIFGSNALADAGSGDDGGSSTGSSGNGGNTNTSTSGSSGLCDFSVAGGCYSTPLGIMDYGWMNYDECNASKAELGIDVCCDKPTCMMGGSAWAGAVKACGGTQNMLNENDLKELANYLYDTDAFSAGGSTEGLTLNIDKAIELGLVEVGTTDVSYLWIWGNTAGPDYATSLRISSDFGPQVGITPVENGSAKVICKK